MSAAPAPPASAGGGAPDPSGQGASGARAAAGWNRATGPSWARGLAALVLCAAVAAAVMWPGLFSGHDTIVGNTGDPSIFVWSLEWTPFAIAHHLNPLVTDYINYPSGANLMWNTSIVFPALVLWPVTALFGPITSYNVMAFLGMTLSGWCAYLALRRWTRHWLSALTGGLLYMLSPYMASQISGHPQLFIAIFPPLLVLLADEILVRQRRPAWLLGMLLGLAAACQLLTGSELLTISAVMAIPALLTLAAVFRGRVAARTGYVLRAAVVSVPVFAILAAYPLYVQLFGPLTVHGALQGFAYYTGVTGFLIPSQLELISGPASVPDSSVYVGLPMLVLAVVVALRLRRRPEVLVAAVTLACAALLALGGHLTIHADQPILPLPWLVVEHLPVLEDVLPVRIMVAGYLALGLITGVFIDAVIEARPRLRLAGLSVAIVALAPLIPYLPITSGRFSVPAFFSDGQAARLASSGSVLVTPYGTDQPYIDYAPEVWQAVAGMPFRTVVAEAFLPGPGGHQWGPALDPLELELHDLGDLGQPAPGALSPQQRRSYISSLRAHRVTAIVVGPSPGETQVVEFLRELLGRGGTATAGVVVWTGLRP